MHAVRLTADAEWWRDMLPSHALQILASRKEAWIITIDDLETMKKKAVFSRFCLWVLDFLDPFYAAIEITMFYATIKIIIKICKR